jgi:hypothetical protein
MSLRSLLPTRFTVSAPAARLTPVALDPDVARRVARFAARRHLPPADALRLLAHAALLELEGRDRRG